jgi:asparagine synthase (glutamine-hydrolysing)
MSFLFIDASCINDQNLQQIFDKIPDSCHNGSHWFAASPSKPCHKGQSTLVSSGTVYNANALQQKYKIPPKSDFILHRLHKISPSIISNAVGEFDGDFAFVHASKYKNRIIVARDPVGVLPLFYGLSRGRIVAFSSDVKALADLPFINSVEEFPAGNVWVSSDHNGFFELYPDIFDPVTIREPMERGIRAVIEQAVHKRIQRDGPLAFLCNPNSDSESDSETLIMAAIAHRLFPDQDMCVFSIRSTQSETRATNGTNTEQVFINIGIKHVDLTESEATYNTETAAEFIGEEYPEYKMILSGQGANELFMCLGQFGNYSTGVECARESIRLIQNIRVEQCSLEIRFPFLDKDVIRHVLSIPGTWRRPSNGTCKALLRQAFEDYK